MVDWPGSTSGRGWAIIRPVEIGACRRVLRIGFRMMFADGAGPQAPVDFYAAAVAVLAIVVFAKFVTHTEKHRSRYPRESWVAKPCVHHLCVGLASGGILVSLAVLGFDDLLPHWIEVTLRILVFVLSGAAGALLVVDLHVVAKHHWAHPLPPPPAMDPTPSTCPSPLAEKDTIERERS